MLGEQGIIAKEEAEKIVTTLKTLLEEIEEGKVEFTKDSEDIHMNMEVLLTQRIGATGKRLHTARSRNDQVALDFRLFVKEEIPVIVGMLLDLEKALLRQAESNLDEMCIRDRPWTITTRTPTRWSRMMSLITALRSSSEIMALPPYLMTMVFPYHF